MRSWRIVVVKISSRSQIWKQVDVILMKGNLETHLEHFHEFYRVVFVITQCIILICFSNIALISGFDQCRESRKFNILCHLVHLVISQLKCFLHPQLWREGSYELGSVRPKDFLSHFSLKLSLELRIHVVFFVT